MGYTQVAKKLQGLSPLGEGAKSEICKAVGLRLQPSPHCWVPFREGGGGPYARAQDLAQPCLHPTSRRSTGPGGLTLQGGCGVETLPTRSQTPLR